MDYVLIDYNGDFLIYLLESSYINQSHVMKSQRN